MSVVEWDTSPASLSFVAASVVVAYVQLKALTPPNVEKNPGREKSDPWALRTFGNAGFLNVLGWALNAHGLLHAAYTVARPVAPSLYSPRPSELNTALLGWSTSTALALALIVLGSGVRMLAYAQLGPNFTFQLARPSGLVTGGLYRYVQHPSYTGIMLIMPGICMTTARYDFGAACFAPDWALPLLPAASAAYMAFMLFFAFVAFPIRIRTEENILRGAFGKEWEEYSRKTPRFIPGIY